LNLLKNEYLKDRYIYKSNLNPKLEQPEFILSASRVLKRILRCLWLIIMSKELKHFVRIAGVDLVGKNNECGVLLKPTFSDIAKDLWIEVM